MPCVLSVVLPSFSVRIDDREKLAKYVRSFRSLPYAATEIADYCFNSYWREKKFEAANITFIMFHKTYL